MLLHEARSADLGHRKRTRVGRGPGSGIGKTCGRGLKGATARSGWTMKASYEGGQMPLFRRLPKRGFRNGPFRQVFAVVNVGDLAGFQAGSAVGPEELRAAGVVQGGTELPVKVLGDGELKVALKLKADAFSKSALAKIEQAGGQAEWIGGAPKKPAPDFKKLEAERSAKGAAKEKAKQAKGAAPAAGEKGKAAKGEGAKAPKGEGEKAPKGAPKPPKAQGAKPAITEPGPEGSGRGKQAEQP